MDLTAAISAAVGLLIGAAFAWAVCRARTVAVHATLVAERDLARAELARLSAEETDFHELAMALAPLTSSLARVERQVGHLERERASQWGKLDAHLSAVASSGEALRSQTARLAGALRSSGVRGTWGEVQLRRVVEHAGMLENVDFDVQVPGFNDQGAGVRPDAIVRLPGGRHVVIDAKVPMSALLSEAETPGEDAATTPLAHAKALRSHLDSLSNKRYWTAFTPSPELVVCFLPSEGLLATACRADPTLLDDALALRVVIATPTTLLAMLRTVALTWQQESLVGNAREVVDAAKELHERVIGLGGVLAKLGRSLTRAVDDYNSVVASVDRRVLAGAKALADLGKATTPLPCVPPISPRAKVPAGHPPETEPLHSGSSSTSCPGDRSRSGMDASSRVDSSSGAKLGSGSRVGSSTGSDASSVPSSRSVSSPGPGRGSASPVTAAKVPP